MNIRTTLISQDVTEITLDLDGKKVTFSSEGFDKWLYDNHSEVYGDFMSTYMDLDIIKFNQSNDAKRYYLQYLSQLINKSIDQWDTARG